MNSATAGLHLALEACGIGPGDEVITTTHTFTATAEVVRYLGADVRAGRHRPGDAVHRPERGRAGRHAEDPGDRARPLRRPVGRHGRDHGHRPPARPESGRGRRARVAEHLRRRPLVGTLDSDAAVFSFYANKTMTTGEGGMVVTRDAAMAKRMRVMRLHGMSRDAFDRFTAKVPSWYYEIVAPGFKYNLTDIAAALGLHQLKKARAFATRRAEIAAAFTHGLAGLPMQPAPQAPAGELHAWHLYVPRLTDAAPIGRDALIEHLFADGIGCSVHYTPLHLQPYWRDRYDLKPAQFPHSQRAYERMLSLPIYTLMSDADVARVLRSIRAALA